MQRWITTLVGVAVVALAIWLVARDFHPPRAIGHEPAPPPGASLADASPAAMTSAGGAAFGDAGPPLLMNDLVAPEPRLDAGVGATLFDGQPVPPLPTEAPRRVRFGVALVGYAGSQPSAGAVRPASRTKAEARVLAERLLVTAQQDFRAAVQQGDSGSSEDLGRIKLGVLEPAPEYVLFTLPVDGIGGPVDTPRGFWIVKRLE